MTQIQIESPHDQNVTFVEPFFDLPLLFCSWRTCLREAAWPSRGSASA